MDINAAIALHQSGRIAEAKTAYETVLAQTPADANAWHRLGIVHLQLGKPLDALSCIEKALAIDPDRAEAHFDLATVLAMLNRRDEAIPHFEKVLALNPAHAGAHNNLGIVLKALHRHAEAVDHYQQALALKPDYAEACNNLGNALQALQRYDEALQCYQRLLLLQPGNVQAHNNLGNALQALNRYEEAILNYQKALALKPDFASAHHNLGNALAALNQRSLAVSHFQQAINLQPEFAEALNSLGLSLHALNRHAEEKLCYERALEIKPGYMNPQIQYIHLCAQQGLWHPDREQDALGRVIQYPNPGEISTFVFLHFVESAAMQKAIACRYASSLAPADNTPVPLRPHGPGADPRIRVAYFSSDFHDHATSYLTAELFELHDPARFDITLFSYGDADGGAIRKRIAGAANFVNLHGLPINSLRERIRAQQPDILIDLKGYTEGTLSRLLAQRIAPLQVNWLGYPGTMGAEFIDYIIADSFIIPDGAEDFYTEKIVRLPGCYQPNDRKRAIAPALTRADYGLPETGVVFCSFNQVAKIRPDIFDLWLDLLGAIDGSVLWIKASAEAERNLKRVALEHGISPERVIIAPSLPPAEHLARYRVADVALDTYPCGSHTTASDALWAGCPLVALAGETFASRVSGSLLNAIGLPELVTHNREDYKRLLLRLAQSAPYRQEVRARLQHNRDTAPLFDTPRFVRNLERAYEAMMERARTGLPTDNIGV